MGNSFIPFTSSGSSLLEVLAPSECSVESLTDRERIERLEQQVAQLSLVLANLVTKGTR